MGSILLYAAFVLSGMAGLVYEVVWARYLGLLVGSSALSQVLVLVVYLGGMGLGSLLVARRSREIGRPLVAYATLEFASGLLGLVFHTLFVVVTDLTYDGLFGLDWLGPSGGAALRWGVASLLVLPHALLLGATFPLMVAGVIRMQRARPGEGVATVYLANAIGGAAGVLLAGFVLIEWVGLPGTARAAGLINLLVFLLVMVAPGARSPAAPWSGPRSRSSERGTSGTPVGRAMPKLMLFVAFASAAASFGYEIAWVRMLALLMGAATHAFEIMLSAFVLGLGLGAWFVRGILDRTDSPTRLLGGIQWMMAVAALATVPIYILSFEAMAGLVPSATASDGGYLYLNAGRYALSLIVMLPATFLAGMALPAITSALLHSGSSERAIGHVYAWNTFGSVTGAALSGLVLLPVLGAKGLLVGAAGIDMALGIVLLSVAAGRDGVARVAPVLAGIVGLFGMLVIGVGVPLDRVVLTGGVFRYGAVPAPGTREIVYYRDAPTATVAVHRILDGGLLVLTTNGKPDASLEPRWLLDRRDTLSEVPVPALSDAGTQLFAPLVGLAHRPDAARVLNIGHGSGMSAAALLASTNIEELTTVEIERAVVEASRSFFPANAAAFSDARARWVFEDAKSYLARTRGPLDLLFSEPSNPWVTGASSLFTKEFYQRARGSLRQGGIIVQWLQLYELDDRLFLTVLSALSREFPWYRGYLVGDGDIVVVASADGPVPDPDWSVFRLPAIEAAVFVDVPPFHPQHGRALELFDQTTMEPLVSAAAPNSDFHPILDLGAERARFARTGADGFASLGTARVDLWRTRAGIRRERPDRYHIPPARGLAPLVRQERAAWLAARSAGAGGVGARSTGAAGDTVPSAFPEWSQVADEVDAFLRTLDSEGPPEDWREWARTFETVEAYLHAGTAGWADSTFYQRVRSYLARTSTPDLAAAVVDFMEGVAVWDFVVVAGAADRLLAPADSEEVWLSAGTLLDGSALAYLSVGRTDDALGVLSRLSERTGRSPDNLRTGLLTAWITEAASERRSP